MRIALDATPLTLSSGGLPRYVSELSLALAREFPEDEYLYLSDQPFSMPTGAPPNLTRGRSVETPAEKHWWVRGRESRRERVSPSRTNWLRKQIR